MNLNLPSSYSEHLEKNNKDDKSDLNKFQKSFNDQSSKLHANVNKNLQKNFKVGIDFPDSKQAQKYGMTTMLGTAFGANPFVTSLVASGVAGKTQTNIKGGQSFKPSGMFGIVEDVSQSLELEALRTNQTTYQKHKLDHQMKFGGDPLIHGFDKPEFNFDNYVKSKDIGFSFDVGGNNMTSVYRTAGSKIYNGAMYDMTQEQARRLEALGKGKAIFYDGKMFDPTNPENSSDLVITDKEGGYDEKGNFHDARFGVSATGRARNRDNLAKEIFGVVNTKTQNLTDKALSIARNQKGGLSKALKEQLNIYKPSQESSDEGGKETKQETKPEYTAVDDFRDFTPPSDFTSFPDPFFESSDAGRDDGGDDVGTGGASISDYGDEEPVAMGGRIGMSNGGNTTEVMQPAGFIAPDPNATDQQEIADDKPMDAKNGDFIINAPAAEDAGKQDIQRMINTAITNLQERGVDVRFGNPKINTADKVKLLVSRNEVYIPAVIAKEIGYDRLKKINNRGKREVQRRQEESQQEEKPQARGFINKAGGDKITVHRGEPYPEQVSKFDKKYMAGRRTTGAWFSSNKSYAKMYGQLQKSLDVTFDEYAKGAKKAEMYRNIASMQSESGKRQLTKDQKKKLFKHVKEVKQMAKQVKDGKIDPKRFVNTLHMALFPEKKEEATIRKIESYKNNPKLFGKLVVRNLANNIVTKGVPFLSKLSPIGSIAGMLTPTEMGDATLDSRGFVDYNPNFPQ